MATGECHSRQAGSVCLSRTSLLVRGHDARCTRSQQPAAWVTLTRRRGCRNRLARSGSVSVSGALKASAWLDNAGWLVDDMVQYQGQKILVDYTGHSTAKKESRRLLLVVSFVG